MHRNRIRIIYNIISSFLFLCGGSRKRVCSLKPPAMPNRNTHFHTSPACCVVRELVVTMNCRERANSSVWEGKCSVRSILCDWLSYVWMSHVRLMILTLSLFMMKCHEEASSGNLERLQQNLRKIDISFASFKTGRLAWRLQRLLRVGMKCVSDQRFFEMPEERWKVFSECCRLRLQRLSRRILASFRLVHK